MRVEGNILVRLLVIVSTTLELIGSSKLDMPKKLRNLLY